MPVFVFCLSKRRIKRIYCVGACMSWRWLPPRIFSCTSLEWRYWNFAHRWADIFRSASIYYRLWFYYSASIGLLSTENIRLIKNVCCLKVTQFGFFKQRQKFFVWILERHSLVFSLYFLWKNFLYFHSRKYIFIKNNS